MAAVRTTCSGCRAAAGKSNLGDGLFAKLTNAIPRLVRAMRGDLGYVWEAITIWARY